MSLVSLVKDAEIQALLNPIIQTIPRTLELPLKVPAQRPRARLVGTAFDYAVRFELQRLSPHARTRPWIAENAAAAVALASLTKVNVQGISTSPISTKVAATYQRIVAEARAFVGAYLAKQSTTATDREEMAKHALRLARLDAYYRNEYLDPEPETIARGDLPDLVEQCLRRAALPDPRPPGTARTRILFAARSDPARIQVL